MAWKEAGESCGIPSPDGLPGWRLPRIDELSALLAGLAESHPFLAPAEGAAFWSASESPFAPASTVRIVLVGAGWSFASALREKAALASRWQVRGPLVERPRTSQSLIDA
jgi:hypothetical protein